MFDKGVDELKPEEEKMSIDSKSLQDEGKVSGESKNSQFKFNVIDNRNNLEYISTVWNSFTLKIRSVGNS